MTSDFLGFDPDTDEVINREDVPHTEPTTTHSQARRIALQLLYEIDSANRKIGHVLNAHLPDSDEPRAVIAYVEKLVRGVYHRRERIDALLQEYASEWPIDQVATIDRNVLRIAIYEMIIADRTPVGVAIDEAVQLGKLYGADNTPRFINGVLGSLADDIDILRERFSDEDTSND